MLFAVRNVSFREGWNVLGRGHVSKPNVRYDNILVKSDRLEIFVQNENCVFYFIKIIDLRAFTMIPNVRAGIASREEPCLVFESYS